MQLEIDKRAMYPWQWSFWQNVQQYMQDADLNWGTPIFKIRILAQFVSHDPFHTQNVFILKVKHILNIKVLKWTKHLHKTRCYWLKCQKLSHLPMQIPVNFVINDKCNRQRLPDTI